MQVKISLKNKIKVLVYTILAYAVFMGASLFYAYTQKTLQGKSALEYLTLSILVFVLFMAMYFYIYWANKKSFNGSRVSLAFLSLVVITSVICFFMTEPLSMYFRPFALAGLVASLIFNRRTGIFINSFSCAMIMLIDLYFTRAVGVSEILLVDLFLGVILGTLFVYFATGLKKRIGIIAMAIKLCGLQFVMGVVISLAGGMTINVLYNGLWALGASLVSMLLFMGALPLYEHVFNFITDFRLHELCDHNNKLLIELREKAPGTFNHSIVLANIAEMCALAIGENSNLARACAYYHDIGKLSNTIYFKENQGDKNPHDDISPEVSVNIIKNHVPNGVKKANDYKLPIEIIDIIKEHHGTLPIKVFYYKALKYTDGSLETNPFSYDGPKPQSKISAIVMISDAAEAAVRTLEKRSSVEVEKVVAEIINERMRLNQFTDCNITFKEIYTIKDVIVKTLSDVYHERIKYPDLALGMQNTAKEGTSND